MENKTKAYPNSIQAIGITTLIIVLLNVLTLLLFVIAKDYLPRTGIFLIGYILAMSICIRVGINFRKEKAQPFLRLFQKIDLKAAFLVAIGTFALDSGIISPITEFIPISEGTKQGFIENLGNMDAFMFLAVVLAAPIFEEYLFRGIMLDGLLKNYSPTWAIIISSLLFGMMHINPLQLVSATIGGLFLGWIYYKSHNLVYCILIHFVINLTGFITIQKIGITTIFEKGIIEIYGGIENMITIFVVASIVFISCMWSLNKRFEKKT